MNYRAEGFLKKRIEKVYRQEGFRGETIGDFKAWKETALKDFEKILRLSAFSAAEFEPVVSSGRVFDGYLRKKCSIQTAEGLRMPFYVLEPTKKGNNIPVIAVHGHGCNGKEGLCGDSINTEKYNYSYALDFVKRGYTVYVPDLLGFGERLEEISIKRGEGSSCNHLNNALTSLGTTLMGLNLFELKRLVDYIEETGADMNGLTAVGFSGGGLDALVLAALDSRVKVCYVSGYYHSFKDTLLKNNLCGCNFVSGLWEHFDIADIGNMVCPRGLIIEYGDSDSLNFGCEEVIDETKRCYEINGAEDNFYVFKGSGDHRFYGLGYGAAEDIIKRGE